MNPSDVFHDIKLVTFECQVLEDALTAALDKKDKEWQSRCDAAFDEGHDAGAGW